jgi:type IV secretory pathway VirB10-like protein
VPPPDRTAEIMRQLAAMQRQLEEQAAALDALRKRPVPVPPQLAQAAKTAPAKLPSAPMLYVSHDLKEAPPGPKAHEYVLAPGGYLPCILETKIVSDVEGYFVCRVSANVYDTKLGKHLLVPQGSKILGNDQANDLVYGSNRMDTVSLTLSLPDGRSVDLGRAPVTDQQGVAGLTGDVNNHYLKLLGAVFIGGALRGGMQAMQTAMLDAAGAGQVASGIGSLGNQAVSTKVQPYINIKPTITVEAGQLANVILLKPLSLPDMWQGGQPLEVKR